MAKLADWFTRRSGSGLNRNAALVLGEPLFKVQHGRIQHDEYSASRESHQQRQQRHVYAGAQLANTGREGIDERTFRLGSKLAW